MSTLAEDVALLRRAAEYARLGINVSVDAEQPLYDALADWWASEAATLAELEPFTGVVNAAIEQASGVRGYLKFERHEDGRIRMRSDTSQAALVAARRYLGLDDAPSPKPRPAPIASIGCTICPSYDHATSDHPTEEPRT